jgi:undecaprenyl diphosphate synthase
MMDRIEREIEKLRRDRKMPDHIAIIMDGNGRWAKRRRLPRLAGHRAGREAVRTTVRTCAKLGIRILSLYTFSLENWKRSKTEIRGLMGFLKNVLKSEYLELKENNIRLRAIGKLDMLPKDTYDILMKTIDDLSEDTGMILNLCLSYSGREEIVNAARRFASDTVSGGIDPQSLNEETFSKYLYAPDLPDPDLLIRTSGELRISNFLLWQIAYTEIVVMDVLWPDFREEHLFSALGQYMGRERRYGAVKRSASRKR